MLELTKILADEQFRRGLASWGFVDLQGKRPFMVSLFGDVFLDSDEGIWFLDTIEGTLERRWWTRDELTATLAEPAGQDQYLLGGLALAAKRRGLILGADEVYSFTPPPVLGGSFDVENIRVIDVVVALDVAGQIHDEVRVLRPGTIVSGVAVDGERPNGRNFDE